MITFYTEAIATPEFLSQHEMQEYVKTEMARRLVKNILNSSRMSLETGPEEVSGNIKLRLKIEIQEW